MERTDVIRHRRRDDLTADRFESANPDSECITFAQLLGRTTRSFQRHYKDSFFEKEAKFLPRPLLHGRHSYG